jgi:L-asparaginase
MEMASVSQAPLSKEPIGDENNPRRVLIIYTGGTIGMKPLDDGSLAPSQGYLTEVLRTMPELTRPGMPQHDVIEYDPLLDSSSMGPVDWRKIACDIETAESTYDGFVVCMGTDTMCYCASALSFMLENLHKPVILTGSLVPHFEIHTDARRNLLCSIVFSANCEIPEVCICFDDKLLRGNRCTKVSSNGFNAFDTPNYPPLAIVGARIYYRHHLTLPMPAQRLRVHKNLECSISVIRLVPGFDDACLFAMARHTPGLKAIVLELYGTGNGPSSKTSLLVAIAEAHKQNILVAAITQCYKGGVSLSSYALGRELQVI